MSKKQSKLKLKVMSRRELRNAYHIQKHAAGRRGIEFLLTFAEWYSIWRKSGKLSKRGKRRGEYQMARRGDSGPYAVGNVRIASQEENKREQNSSPRGKEVLSALIAIARNPSAETRLKISLAGRGRPKPPGFAEKISAARRDGRIPSPPVGETNPCAKLTNKQVRAIRAAYVGKRVLQPALAAKYGVSTQLISNVVTHKSYVDA